MKERNRIKTQEHERQRVDAGYGELESSEREREVCCSTSGIFFFPELHVDPAEQVQNTQRAIKHVLTERWYAYKAATDIVAKDPDMQKVFEVRTSCVTQTFF